MSKEDLSKEEADKIVDALDEAIQTGPWQKTRLLKTIGMRLQSMRAAFKKRVDEVYGVEQKTTSHLANRVALRQGQQLVYVSLYNAEGENINCWERIVYNLAAHVVTRPIYSAEGEVKSMIRSKVKPVNEAYVSVYISQESLLSPPEDKIPRDKLGQALLSLKDKSLSVKNMVTFYHISGVYHYEHGRLIREGDMHLGAD